MKKLAIAVIWVYCGLAAAGAFNAHLRDSARMVHQSPMWAAQTQSFSIGLGLAGGPLALLVAPVMTGGFYSGWTLTRQPFPCTRDPEVWCKP